MHPRFVDGDALSSLLSMSGAIDALEQAFLTELPVAPDRAHLDVGGGDLLLMPSWSGSAAGVKLVTVAPGNPEKSLPLIQGIYALFTKPELTPIALFEAAALTALRTAAVSGVATRHLARRSSKRLVIFGAGVQARSHLDAMLAVCDIEELAVVSRGRDPATTFVDRAREIGVAADLAEPGAVGHADVICTCTTSSHPLFDGRLLPAGVHVNAVGSYKPSARELDDESVRRARIVVDTATALRESGDLMIPLDSGVLAAEDVQELTYVIRGGGGRTATDEITLFKSVGAAFEDLVIAEAAAARLQRG